MLACELNSGLLASVGWITASTVLCIKCVCNIICLSSGGRVGVERGDLWFPVVSPHARFSLVLLAGHAGLKLSDWAAGGREGSSVGFSSVAVAGIGDWICWETKPLQVSIEECVSSTCFSPMV